MDPPLIPFSALPPLSDSLGGFPRFRWDIVEQYVRTHVAREQRSAAFAEAARAWVDALRAALGGGYRVVSTPHALLLTARDGAEAASLASAVEDSRALIVDNLEQVAWQDPEGPHVVLDFEEPDDFAQYVVPVAPSVGEPLLMSGVCLREGYVHVALNAGSERRTRIVVCHEMVHVLLSHLALPHWVEEGIAQWMQKLFDSDPVAGEVPDVSDLLRQHLPYVRRQGLEGFWSGRDFSGSDEGQQFCYALAELLIRRMNGDSPHNFDDFLLLAHHADGGQSAARHVFGSGLEDYVARLLGRGDWVPRFDGRELTWHVRP